ncbi:hypothetical protein AMJ85_05275 [candidate division BRC1 bacterium SM23_51]|nr:MAG: hypothetical protein AMJ85_05275 [candidate division BRC1 bacterium SM23_51]
MPAEWTFGGEGDVPELDIGQPGGALHGAGQAHATMSIAMEPERINEEEFPLPQIDATFSQLLGFAGHVIRLHGMLRALSDTVMDNIEAAIRSYKSGHVRDRTDAITEALERAQPTTLSLRTGLTREQVVLLDYRPIGSRRRGPTWYLQEAELVFKVVA